MARGTGTEVVLVLVLVLMLVQVQGATYTVGGSQGWGFQIQKSRWTAGKSFKAGDVLEFNYKRGVHNVVKVNKGGYNSCNKGTSPTLTTGSDKISLNKGANYFICTIPGHCEAGMKMSVTAA